MYYELKSRSHRVPLLIGLLIGSIALFAQAAVMSAHARGGSPLRLRLRVETNTLRPGQTTRVFVEFLDRDYCQVPNDGARVVEFGIAGGSGAISPPRVTVNRGAWSADATFASGQPGKVMITARTEGLDSAQTILLVIRPAASFVSRLFETVAYAGGFDGFEIWPRTTKTSASDNSRAKFLVSFLEPPPANTTIRISTNPAATVIYNGQKIGAVADIKLGQGKGVSEDIEILSEGVEKVEVVASVLPDGPKASASANFTAPRPTRIVFDDEVRDILSTQSDVPISIQLADDGGNFLGSDEERHVTLRRACDQDPVEFDPPSLVFSPTQRVAQAILHLKGLPWGNELTLLAVSSDPSVRAGRKTIVIRSPIEKVVLRGPSKVTGGKPNAEFTVHLADKDGTPRIADWDRRIDLSATSGAVNPAQVTILRGQDGAKVQYFPANSTGRILLKAESGGLADGSLEILLVTASYWLMLASLCGGLVGGVVRHLLGDYKLKSILPKKVNGYWELGLVGRILGSVASGLFLYLTVKFGLGRMIGSTALPTALDLDTSLVAFFFGGIGGFAGTMVFERLVSWCLPPPTQATQSVATSAN